MELILKFYDLIKDDLVTALMGTAILFVLFIINTLLGIYKGTKFEGFKIKKLIEGILKNIFCLLIPLFMFYVVLDFIPIWLERIGISGLQGIVSFLEAMGVIAIAIRNYVTDIYDKYLAIYGVDKADLPEHQTEYYG